MVPRWLEGVPEGPGKIQKEGQGDQGTLQQLEGIPLATLPVPGPLSFFLAFPWDPWNSLKPLYLGDRSEGAIAGGCGALEGGQIPRSTLKNPQGAFYKAFEKYIKGL